MYVCSIIAQERTNQFALSSSSGEDGFCSSETKHNRNMATRPTLFISARILQEQRPQLRKTVLGSSPDEVVFCSSETKNDKRTAPKPKFLFRGKEYRNKGQN
jgi:hypothetical protein